MLLITTSRRANKKVTTGDDHATGTPELSEDGQKIVDTITMQLDMLKNEFKLKCCKVPRLFKTGHSYASV